MRWVIQNNLISENDLNQIQDACKAINVEFEEVQVIPYLKVLPEFTLDDNNVYYGSTTLMNNLYEKHKPKGLFYNHETFSMENYIKQWGEHMLNCDAQVLTVGEFFKMDKPDDENIFIRPDADSKAFDGQVSKFKNAKTYIQRHLDYETEMDLETKILVGPAYNIFKEWRNYVVDGKVVTSSLYRQNFKLKKSGDDIPQSMLDFVQERINEYKPHDNFAIDIASTHDGTYYIIECGCLNSVGLYHCNIPKLVESISTYMQNV
jgi:hypothetical protein